MSSLSPVTEWTVKVLTEKGMAAMLEEWERAKDEEQVFNNAVVLNPPENTADFLGGKCAFQGITHGSFTKKQLAERIYSAFVKGGERVEPHLGNSALWCWFMCKIGPLYHLKPEAHKISAGTGDEKIILSGDGYRHHMANLAWVQELIAEHNIGLVMLTGKNTVFGEFQEQVIQGHIMRSHACLKLLDELAYDDKKESWIKDRNVPKNRRNTYIARYTKAWLYKLNALHDVHSMSYDRLKGLAIDSGRFSGTWDDDGTTKTFDLLA